MAAHGTTATAARAAPAATAWTTPIARTRSASGWPCRNRPGLDSPRRYGAIQVPVGLAGFCLGSPTDPTNLFGCGSHAAQVSPRSILASTSHPPFLCLTGHKIAASVSHGCHEARSQRRRQCRSNAHAQNLKPQSVDITKFLVGCLKEHGKQHKVRRFIAAVIGACLAAIWPRPKRVRVQKTCA